MKNAHPTAPPLPTGLESFDTDSEQMTAELMDEDDPQGLVVLYSKDNTRHINMSRATWEWLFREEERK